jgi:hypothetical protein
MIKAKKVLKTSEFELWNDNSDSKKSKKKPFCKKKFHTRTIFREPYSAFYDFINAFCMDLFNEYSNFGNNNVINSKL